MSILFDSEPDTHELPPPFPWFGGKSRAAPLVWSALGNVANYVEPFAGSLAVLLARPSSHFQTPRIETVNDKDHYLSNFWRAVSFAPDEVARWADWPINEDDLYSRHLWLVNEGGPRLTEGIESDPEYFDAKIAGWWFGGFVLGSVQDGVRLDIPGARNHTQDEGGSASQTSPLGERWSWYPPTIDNTVS